MVGKMFSTSLEAFVGRPEEYYDATQVKDSEQSRGGNKTQKRILCPISIGIRERVDQAGDITRRRTLLKPEVVVTY